MNSTNMGLAMLVSIALMIPVVADNVAKMLGTTKNIIQASAFNTLMIGAGLVLIVTAPLFVAPILAGTMLVAGLIS